MTKMSSTINYEMDSSVVEKLRFDLNEAHKEIRFQDIEIARLNEIRRNLEREIEELSAKLFEEAYKIVNEAHQKQLQAEKITEEQRLKVEMLTAEVQALKLLVLTSTPSQPNTHLHPQINSKKITFFNFHRRAPSHCNLLYGRTTDNGPANEVENSECDQFKKLASLDMELVENRNEFEVSKNLMITLKKNLVNLVVVIKWGWCIKITF